MNDYYKTETLYIFLYSATRQFLLECCVVRLGECLYLYAKVFLSSIWTLKQSIFYKYQVSIEY